MSTSSTSKATLRHSKFIEGPPITSTAPNLAQSDEQLHTILLEMDFYESSRISSQRKCKSRTSSSSSSNSNSSHSSTPSMPFFTSFASKRMSHDPSSPILISPTSPGNKRFSGLRASLDMSNSFAALLNSDNTPGNRGSTIGSIIVPKVLDEGSVRDGQISGSKAKGRLRAWSRAKDDGVRSYTGT
ncbi:hypothetical protein NHQ30_000837 [Ciborinia camelliae]|nr:hypothetical protein NHQ30_000837 [Ciborinia camelliae]